MPSSIDPLNGRLANSYQQALRALYGHQEIALVSWVFWRVRPPWKVDTRKCFDSFLLLPMKGKIRVGLKSGSRIVGPGEYLMLSEGESHSVEIVKGVAHLEQISIHCHIYDRWRQPLLSQFSSPFGKLSPYDFWQQNLSDVASLMVSDPELGRWRGEAVIKELLANHLRNEKKLKSSRREGDSRIEQVLRRMKEDFSSPHLSIEALADEVGITSTQMRKLFRLATNTGPKHYLTRLRLEKATYLLRHTTQSIKEVAFECGFASDNYFHLVFQQAFKCTPHEYRQKDHM